MDKRIEKTYVKLVHALAELLKENDYNNLIVQDILDKAGVARSTFYKHYSSIDDLLRFIVKTIFERASITDYLDEENDSQTDYSQLIVKILNILKESKDKISIIISNNSSIIFFEELKKRMLPIIERIVSKKMLINNRIPYKLSLELAQEEFIVLIKHWFGYNCEAYPSTIASYFIYLNS